jgi:quercetin dioxygenase-like cupin family protein
MTITAYHTAPDAGTPYEMADGTHTVKVAAADTGGAFEVFEVLAPPGPAAPRHASPWHSVMYLLEGRVTVHVGNAVHELGPGATMMLPPEMPYTFAVTGDDARFLAVTSGDLAGRFFKDFARSVPTDRPVADILPQILAVTARHGVTLGG